MNKKLQAELERIDALKKKVEFDRLYFQYEISLQKYLRTYEKYQKEMEKEKLNGK